MATGHQLLPTHEVRLYQSGDAPSLDGLLGTEHGVRLDRDRISCLAASGGPVVGVLAWRPGGIVHELRVGDGLLQQRRANLLVDFAIGDAVSQPFPLYEAIFICDSDAMAHYARELGAIEETGKRVFTLDLRKSRTP